MSVILTGFSSSVGKAILDKFVNEKNHVFCLGRNKNKINDSFDDQYTSFFYLDFQSKNFCIIFNKFINIKFTIAFPTFDKSLKFFLIKEVINFNSILNFINIDNLELIIFFIAY